MPTNHISDIKEIIVRDLGTLASRIEQTPEEQLWKPMPGIINPAGTLAIHLCGNLRHFIGGVLGGDGYIRSREAEFSHMPLTKEEIIHEIRQTQEAVGSALDALHPERLHETMPDTPPQHQGRTIGFFLIQLCCHLSWHRGQADYLTRILAASQA